MLLIGGVEVEEEEEEEEGVENGVEIKAKNAELRADLKQHSLTHND